jgi:hypothetical protein
MTDKDGLGSSNMSENRGFGERGKTVTWQVFIESLISQKNMATLIDDIDCYEITIYFAKLIEHYSNRFDPDDIWMVKEWPAIFDNALSVYDFSGYQKHKYFLRTIKSHLIFFQAESYSNSEKVTMWINRLNFRSCMIEFKMN